MKKSDVRIGGVYEVRVGNRLARVRLDAMKEGGKWTGTDLDTSRTVKGWNAGRLRRLLGIAPTAVGSLTTTVADVHRQWQALKASNPDTVLLFRVGEDRFEAYSDDATVCGKVLGLAPAWRVIGETPTDFPGTPTVTFPSANLEFHIIALVAAGHRVAVCERVQPGEAREKPIEKIIVPV